MQAGKLNQKLILERRTITQNDSGEDEVTWSQLATYWADVRALTGREMEQVQQRWAKARFQIVTRYNPSVAAKREDRLAWGDRYLDVLDVEDPDGNGRQLVWYAQEFVE